MQDGSLAISSGLAPAPDVVPVPSNYEAAEEYAMGMLSALQGTAALGAGLHIAGSLLIVYGQTLVKVCQVMLKCTAACLDCTQQCASGQDMHLPAPDAGHTRVLTHWQPAGCSADGGNFRSWQNMEATTTPIWERAISMARLATIFTQTSAP